MVRILALPTPFAYVNPTYELLLGALERRNVLLAGPRTRLRSDRISRIISERGGFDCILCDPWFFIQAQSIPTEYRPMDLFDCGLPIIVSLMQYDLHGLTDDLMAKIKSRSAAAVATVGRQFIGEIRHDVTTRESWITSSHVELLSSKQLDDHLVCLPHCVSNDEFAHTAWPARRTDVIIPGYSYYFRRRAKDHLSTLPDLTIGGVDDIIQKVLSLMVSWYPFGAKTWRLNRPIGIELYRKRYRAAIAAAKVGVACDGSIGYPVRKFFEIPALGTLLMARFFRQPEALGFLDGENCISATSDDPRDLEQQIRFALSDSDAAEGIARAGQEMVRELHTAERRADQLIQVAAAIAEGRQISTRWEDGSLKIEARKHAGASVGMAVPTS